MTHKQITYNETNLKQYVTYLKKASTIMNKTNSNLLLSGKIRFENKNVQMLISSGHSSFNKITSPLIQSVLAFLSFLHVHSMQSTLCPSNVRLGITSLCWDMFSHILHVGHSFYYVLCHSIAMITFCTAEVNFQSPATKVSFHSNEIKN